MSLLAAVVFAGFVGLGIWQLQRATEKVALYASFESADEVNLRQPPATLGDARYRSLEIRGRYVADRQFLIDNMVENGRVGYHVLTPFRITGFEKWMIVNRGWVPARSLRSELPRVAVGALERTISGKLDRLPRPGLRLESVANPGLDWPQVVVFPSIEDLAQALEMPLFNYQLLLDPERFDGYQRVWQPRVMGPNKHRAYAAQWFVFALVLVALFFVLNLHEEEAEGG